MPYIDRGGLLRLLDESDDSMASECALALRAGADYDGQRITIPALVLAQRYREARDDPHFLLVKTQGVERAIEQLEGAGEAPVCFSKVEAGRCLYGVIMPDDGTTVLACISQYRGPEDEPLIPMS
jgi:hypothetical protein